MKSLPVRHDPQATLNGGEIQLFNQRIADQGFGSLTARSIQTLQINVGKLCNLTCHHCHVDAGPHRTEIMTRDTIDIILSILERTPQISIVDVTGGAPEMNPHFEHLVTGCSSLGRHVIDRCNLTVFFVKGKRHIPQFLADHQVEIIASLPCYSEENVDQQRGKGVFDRSVAALKQLNALGYGIEGSGLVLNLVFNPLGPKLPPLQAELESDYKSELLQKFGLVFNRLYTITNMPINRFLDDLEETGQTDEYFKLLINSFNPSAIDGLMCRGLISVGWDGRLYDCDFNQMMAIPVAPPYPQTIETFEYQTLAKRHIVTDQHCYGCTAGSGSSCSGALAQ
jgi:radical SAM/Cys-rich protein